MNNPEDKSTSEALAAIIVAYRALGLFKEEAKQAMSELARREAEGDKFDYEQYIKSKLADVPKPELNEDTVKLMASIARTGILE